MDKVFGEYVCYYLAGANSTARAVYRADSWPTAMRMHNSSLPEYATKVIKWVTQEGITFLMHDSRMTMDNTVGVSLDKKVQS